MVLHGGAGWCMGYWGALWFFIEKGIVPVGFVARSSGAFIALSYAFGWEDKHGRDYYGGFNLADYFKDGIGIPLFDVNKYQKFTGQYSDKKKLSELKTPVYLTAVNMTDRKIEYLHDDIKVTDALTITTAIPGLIGPIHFNGKSYYDGETAKGNDVGFAKSRFKDSFVIEMGRDSMTNSRVVNYLAASAQNFFHANTDYQLDDKAHFRLNISNLVGTPFSTDHIDENVKIGYEAASAAWEELHKSLKEFYR